LYELSSFEITYTPKNKAGDEHTSDKLLRLQPPGTPNSDENKPYVLADGRVATFIHLVKHCDEIGRTPYYNLPCSVCPG
jgi:hypothetical protein